MAIHHPILPSPWIPVGSPHDTEALPAQWRLDTSPRAEFLDERRSHDFPKDGTSRAMVETSHVVKPIALWMNQLGSIRVGAG